jgi:hypothetical protein
LTDAKSETRRVLAASQAGVISPIQTLPRLSEEWRTVNELLPSIFRRYEPPVWEGVSDDFRPNLTGPLLRPVLEHAFTTVDEQGQFLYFESRRDYIPRPGRLDEDHAFIQGWLWRRSASDSFQAIEIRAYTRDGDGKGPHSFSPLGLVRHGGRRFWLGETNAYASGGLVVLDVRRNEVQQVAVAGYPGC